MKFCTECGKQLDEKQRFCDNCGSAQEVLSNDSEQSNILEHGDTQGPTNISIQNEAQTDRFETETNAIDDQDDIPSNTNQEVETAIDGFIHPEDAHYEVNQTEPYDENDNNAIQADETISNQTIKSQETLYCSNCGTENVSTNDFCLECGQSFINQTENSFNSVSDSKDEISTPYPKTSSIDRQPHFCSNCGYKNYAGDIECVNCHESLLDYPDEMALENTSYEKNNSKNKKLWLIPLSVIGLLAISALVFVFARDYFVPQSNQQTSLNNTSQLSENESSNQSNEQTAVTTTLQAISDGETSMTDNLTSQGAETVSNQDQPEQSSQAAQTVETTFVQIGADGNPIATGDPNAQANAPAVDDTAIYDRITAIFNQGYGSIGNSSLFFQRITDANGNPINTNPLIINDQPIRAASVIKLFILTTLYQQAAQGTIDLNQIHTVSATDVEGGTGIIVNYGVGSTFTLRELAKLMITVSDNTAANILINYVGGFPAIQANMQTMGYSQSRMARVMLDTTAIANGNDNYVSAKEVADLLLRLYNKSLISPELDQEIMGYLADKSDSTKTDFLGYYLGSTTYYNKTGQYSTYGIVNDAMLVSSPKGTYILVALTQDGDYGSQVNLISDLGSSVYNIINE